MACFGCLRRSWVSSRVFRETHWRLLEAAQSLLEGLLGISQGCFTAPWGFLDGLGAVLELSCGCLGLLRLYWRSLGAFWGGPGALWVASCWPLGRLLELLGGSMELLGTLWRPLGELLGAKMVPGRPWRRK